MTSAVKDGLMATVGSGGSFLPERHTITYGVYKGLLSC